jgi:SAM-dependent methyltransferase
MKSSTDFHESPENSVERHYCDSDLTGRLSAALKSADLHTEDITWSDLSALDQFHVRGLAATKEMAEGLDLQPGATVLDIGCGLGGPARFLTATRSAKVTAIDLCQPYIDIARILTENANLSVTYLPMNALDLHFEDRSFDCVWTQHVAMNIEDRARLYSQMHRVLKPGGRLAIYDVTAGAKGPLIYPVPWARTKELSFLLTPQEMRKALNDAGFNEISWNDKTASGIEWFEQQARRSPEQAKPALGLHIVMGPEFAEMAANFARNLNEGRAGLLQAIVQRD